MVGNPSTISIVSECPVIRSQSATSMLSHRVCYNELGDLYLDKLNKHHLTRNLVHRLERLGYTVTLEQKAA